MHIMHLCILHPVVNIMVQITSYNSTNNELYEGFRFQLVMYIISYYDMLVYFMILLHILVWGRSFSLTQLVPHSLTALIRADMLTYVVGPSKSMNIKCLRFMTTAIQTFNRRNYNEVSNDEFDHRNALHVKG